MVKDPLCPHVSVEPPDCYDRSAWELDAYDGTSSEYTDCTVHDVCESVETNLWLADAYRKRRAYGLARECERAACNEFRRFADILTIYAGADFGRRVQLAARRLKRYAASHASHS